MILFTCLFIPLVDLKMVATSLKVLFDGDILSKYGIHSLQNSVFDIKEMMWAEFTRNVGL